MRYSVHYPPASLWANGPGSTDTGRDVEPSTQGFDIRWWGGSAPPRPPERTPYFWMGEPHA